jgi:hypothetical protein
VQSKKWESNAQEAARISDDTEQEIAALVGQRWQDLGLAAKETPDEVSSIANRGGECDPGRPANLSASTTSVRSRAYPFPLSMAVRAIAASENQMNQLIKCTLDCAGAWGVAPRLCCRRSCSLNPFCESPRDPA